ncbi:hypothetical protein ASG40_13115 [Methylobacterium sp. Leaf399]|uniref:TerC family protein n=1 Tax=unclassified Methylobacterium TaxID=2615210 RepID=UPI0006FC4D09|nr:MULTISPECIES: TerC family protein [unclassified Methylobacterium]KQP50859.1 hypothetical protein ASF39_11495 [Methylobacterium sp. Leaf108]KQT07841.1 hypothetical protein ASG40_13115 [Methylobacterium sp. Leaf399]KQT88956.1 hypothetical protein ASG59_13890 [Methylobacterium sp. Leaf466]
MDFSSPTFYLSVLQIIWIDLLLSGDNAVVIALAVRGLPAHQRKVGIWLGAGAAVLLRMIFAGLISYLLNVPFLKVVGALLLLWIAIKLVVGEEEEETDIATSGTMWKAVWTIVVADAVMSLDNVIAIAAAAKGHYELFIFGLLLSVPLVVFGATLVSNILKRYPAIVWAGGALLGWVAGEMFIGDNFLLTYLQPHLPAYIVANPHSEGYLMSIGLLHYGVAALGVLIVLAVGLIIVKRKGGHHGSSALSETVR